MTEGPVINLFDMTIARGDMYRSFVFPGQYPEERPARLENWHPEDLEAFCGGEYARS